MALKDIQDYLDGTHSSQKKKTFGFSDTETTAEKSKRREVGETWEEINPVTGVITVWEQKQGYRVKYPKNSILGEVNDVRTKFWNCPKDKCTCTNPTRLDEKFRMLQGQCSDCVIRAETMMKVKGEYEEYERKRMKENALAWLKDAEADVTVLKESIMKTEFINEDGSVEKWEMANRDEIIEKIDAEFEIFKKELLESLDK